MESNRSKKFQSPKVRTWTFFGFEVNVIETVIESDPKWTVQKGESGRSLNWTVARKWTVLSQTGRSFEPNWTVMGQSRQSFD